MKILGVLLLMLLLGSLYAGDVSASPCERLLPVMVTIRQGEQQLRMPRLTPAQETDWRSWNALCQDKPWPQRLHAALHPGTPYGQGWGAALGLETPSAPMYPVYRIPFRCVGGRYSGIYCY